MAVPSYDRSRIQPGYDQAEVESCLESFFDQLAEQYPDRVITWSTWDHENWDRPAKHLCRAFGYSRGKELFNAFGYQVVDAVKAEDAVPDKAADEEPAETEENAADGAGEPEETDEEAGSEVEDTEAEDSVPALGQKNAKRRNRNRVTVGQILFILLFLATAYGVYWIVNFG